MAMSEFQKAFAAARAANKKAGRRAGDGAFTFNGKSYHARTADEEKAAKASQANREMNRETSRQVQNEQNRQQSKQTEAETTRLLATRPKNTAFAGAAQDRVDAERFRRNNAGPAYGETGMRNGGLVMTPKSKKYVIGGK